MLIKYIKVILSALSLSFVSLLFKCIILVFIKVSKIYIQFLIEAFENLF